MTFPSNQRSFVARHGPYAISCQFHQTSPPYLSHPVSRQNRSLNLALEKERALSVQLASELRSAKASLASATGNGNTLVRLYAWPANHQSEDRRYPKGSARPKLMALACGFALLYCKHLSLFAFIRFVSKMQVSVLSCVRKALRMLLHRWLKSSFCVAQAPRTPLPHLSLARPLHPRAQAAEDAAREVVREAAQAADAAEREAAMWQEKFQQATDRCMQAEAKVAPPSILFCRVSRIWPWPAVSHLPRLPHPQPHGDFCCRTIPTAHVLIARILANMCYLLGCRGRGKGHDSLYAKTQTCFPLQVDAGHEFRLRNAEPLGKSSAETPRVPCFIRPA